ncbi:hypothetical protein ABZT43_39825 [Streptomyces sp. NPDC005349]|uniref:phosphotransferase family protein n=1 Tax=Streptomyces sp. NPDC005349 TaxID=3157037 RepID=UPI0033BE47EB
MEAVTLADLPALVREAVARQAGPVLAVTSIAAGHNSPLSVRLETYVGPLFVKGLPVTSPSRVATQCREYEISRHLHGLGPRARWQIRAGGWHLVAFDYLNDARHADYRPESGDLASIANLLQQVARLPIPEGVDLRRAEQRLFAYGTEDQLRHVTGNTLLHTDLNPHNVLLTEDGTAHLVDWGMGHPGRPLARCRRVGHLARRIRQYPQRRPRLGRAGARIPGRRPRGTPRLRRHGYCPVGGHR